MKNINDTLKKYEESLIDKSEFIKIMYENHHSHLFNYANYLKKTNIKKIEIEDDNVIVTTRNKGIRIACLEGDYRTAPIDILNFSEYEKYEYAMVEKLIKNGDNFIDIGANIGWYSINIAKAKRDSKIYCFEPIPGTYEYLQKNINLNFIKNIITHNIGLSNKTGEFTYYYYQEGSGNASSINLTGREDIKEVQCNVITLDDYCKEKKIRADFIKCDVEGAELLVFQGGLVTIQHDLPIIFSEVLRKWSAKFAYDPNLIFNLFSEIGYKAYTVKEKTLIDFKKMEETTIETNFFFLHAKKHANIIKKYVI